MYNDGEMRTPELWAVVDKDGNIIFSRGGSSSKPKLLVYPNERKAIAGLKNFWTQQIHREQDFVIKCIYCAGG